MKKGDKLLCKNDIFDSSNYTLFKRGEIYEINYIENETIKILICINHESLYTRINEFNIEWVFSNFETI